MFNIISYQGKYELKPQWDTTSHPVELKFF